MPLGRRTLALITGASRGLGRELAVQLAAALAPGSVLVLVARSGAGLAATAAVVRAAAPHGTVVQRSYDLAACDAAGLTELVTAGLRAAGQPLQAAYIIHNAGTVGDVSRSMLQLDSVQQIDGYLHTNVSACVALNAVFVRLVTPVLQSGQAAITVVNITSLCALQPFKSMSLYCAGKAARNMMFAVLAAEAPDIRVLSYAPGPLVTDMAREVATSTMDDSIRQMFVAGLEDGFLECSVTTKKLLDILREDKYTSGAHVDFYDKDE